jgi:hypothetical protein
MTNPANIKPNGGGCTVYEITLPDGGYVWATDEGGSTAPEPGDTVLVAIYDADDFSLGQAVTMTYDEWLGVRYFLLGCRNLDMAGRAVRLHRQPLA